MNKQEKRKWMKELLVDGYLRNSKIIFLPREITLLIQLFCPIHPPYCHILFDFESDKKAYLKIGDIFPNLVNNPEISNITNTSNNNVIFATIKFIDWFWHDQYLTFEKVDEEDQDCMEFDYKLIQADNNEVQPEKWQHLIKNLSASNIGINGFVKKPRQFLSTAVAFDKMDHRILDLIKTEFTDCELRAKWFIPMYDHDAFKWNNYNYNTINDSYTPSEWILKILKMSALDFDNVPIYFGDRMLTTSNVYCNLHITVADDTFWKYNWGNQAEIDGVDDDWLDHSDYMDLSLYSKDPLLSACIGGGNQQFEGMIRKMLTVYKWTQSSNEIIEKLDQTGSINLDCYENKEILVTTDALRETLCLVDKVAQFYQTDITIDGGVLHWMGVIARFFLNSVRTYFVSKLIRHHCI